MLKEYAGNQHKYISEEQKEKKNNLKEITLKFLLQLGKKNEETLQEIIIEKSKKKKKILQIYYFRVPIKNMIIAYD